jgi:hypothetical protein
MCAVLPCAVLPCAVLPCAVLHCCISFSLRYTEFVLRHRISCSSLTEDADSAIINTMHDALLPFRIIILYSCLRFFCIMYLHPSCSSFVCFDFLSLFLVHIAFPPDGNLLATGKPSSPMSDLPPLRERQTNYRLVQGSKYARAADQLARTNVNVVATE